MIREIYRATLPFHADPEDDIIAIGDIHGCYDQFNEMVQFSKTLKTPENKNRVNILTGDIIDRGSENINCMDLAMEFANISVMGNHEQMLLISLLSENIRNSDLAGENWFLNGGENFIGELINAGAIKFDVNFNRNKLREAIGWERVQWLQKMKSHHKSGNILFIHAGLNPRSDFHESVNAPWDIDYSSVNSKNLNHHWAWIREPFLLHNPGVHGHKNHFVVHGHTTPESDPIRISNQANYSRINIDGGSYKTGLIRMAHISDNHIYVYENENN